MDSGRILFSFPNGTGVTGSGIRSFILSTVRKKKLDQIRHPELQPYVAQLRRLGYACYQESITEELLQDLLDGTAK